MVTGDSMEQNNEQLLELNYNKMQKLKKLFKAAFIVSAIPSALYIVFGLVAAAVAVMTAGMIAPPIFAIILWLVCVIAFACFSFSRNMEQNGTLASILAIIVQMILCLIIGWEFVLFPLLTGLTAQIICFTKYNEIQYLKEQPGYPDFNTVYLRNQYNNRIVSDNEIQRNLTAADAQMDEINFDNKGNIL